MTIEKEVDLSGFIVAEVAQFLNEAEKKTHPVTNALGVEGYKKVVREALPELELAFKRHLKVNDLKDKAKAYEADVKSLRLQIATGLKAKEHEEKPTPSIPSEITITHKVDESQKYLLTALAYFNGHCTGLNLTKYGTGLQDKVKKALGLE